MAVLVQVAAEVAQHVSAKHIVRARVRVNWKGREWGPGEVGSIDPEIGLELPPEVQMVLPATGPLAAFIATGVATQTASLLNAVSDGIRGVIRGGEGSPCYDCNMRNALPQSPQKRTRRVVSSRKG